MDIGPQMCARYSLTQEEITILIGEIEVSRGSDFYHAGIQGRREKCDPESAV